MKSIVLDTNIFVAAAFNKKSSAKKIIEWVEEEKFSMLWTKDTKEETKHIISKIPPINWKEFEQLFKSKWEITDEVKNSDLDIGDNFKVIKDYSDRKFALLAKVAGSPIISNDSDFLDVRDKLDIKVYTSSEFKRSQS
jgi:predicted nucleic acid-binding protein